MECMFFVPILTPPVNQNCEHQMSKSKLGKTHHNSYISFICLKPFVMRKQKKFFEKLKLKMELITQSTKMTELNFWTLLYEMPNLPEYEPEFTWQIMAFI